MQVVVDGGRLPMRVVHPAGVFEAEVGGATVPDYQSLGVALIGAIVLAGLTGAFISHIQNDERINQQVATQVSTAAGTGVDFVASTEIETAAQDAGLSESTTEAIVDDYEEAQLVALKAGLLAAALLAFVSLAFTGDLPHELSKPDDREAEPAPT